MPANIDPIYVKTGVVNFADLTAANVSRDGIGAVLLFTAGPEGALIRSVRLRSKGTNVASACRLFLNNGTDPVAAANTALIEERALPATTAIETAALAPIDMPLDIFLPAGFRLYACVTVAVAAGWKATAIGGNY